MTDESIVGGAFSLSAQTELTYQVGKRLPRDPESPSGLGVISDSSRDGLDHEPAAQAFELLVIAAGSGRCRRSSWRLAAGS